MWCSGRKAACHVLVFVGGALVTSFPSDAGLPDLAAQLMNHERCLLNRVSVVVRQGLVAPRSMHSIALARFEKIDQRMLKIISTGSTQKSPTVLQLTEVNGRYFGYLDTEKERIMILECDPLPAN
jgi:hypothetical protein